MALQPLSPSKINSLTCNGNTHAVGKNPVLPPVRALLQVAAPARVSKDKDVKLLVKRLKQNLATAYAKYQQEHENASFKTPAKASNFLKFHQSPDDTVVEEDTMTAIANTTANTTTAASMETPFHTPHKYQETPKSVKAARSLLSLFTSSTRH